jgi:hypothetical protein
MYAVEMGSGVMITRLHKHWFRPSKVNRGIHRLQGDRISLY